MKPFLIGNGQPNEPTQLVMGPAVAMSPNIDGHLYCIVEDEKRNEQRCPVLQFILINGQVIPVSLLPEGKLAVGGKRLERSRSRRLGWL